METGSYFNNWVLVVISWVAAIAMLVTVVWNLVVGYSWTLPIVGIVHGPASALQQVVFSGIFGASLVVGSLVSFTVLLKGSPTQRLVGLLPSLCFSGVIVILVWSPVSG